MSGTRSSRSNSSNSIDMGLDLTFNPVKTNQPAPVATVIANLLDEMDAIIAAPAKEESSEELLGATSEESSTADADATSESSSEKATVKSEESSLSERSAKKNPRPTDFEGVADTLVVHEDDLKQQSINVQNKLNIFTIREKLGDLENYSKARFAADSKEYKKLFGLFNKKGYSKTEKQIAFNSLEDLFKGHGPVSKKNEAVLRDGVLGKTLRKAAGELAVELNLPEIATVRGLLAYVAKIVPPAPVVATIEDEKSESSSELKL